MSKIGDHVLKLAEQGIIQYNHTLHRYVWTNAHLPSFGVDQTYAEILLSTGFATNAYVSEDHWYICTDPNAKTSAFDSELDPAADTYEGHLQAFAIEDWLKEEARHIWDASKNKFPPHPGMNSHRYRLKRMRWSVLYILENGL